MCAYKKAQTASLVAAWSDTKNALPEIHKYKCSRCYNLHYVSIIIIQ